jgi:hypothetical protein
MKGTTRRRKRRSKRWIWKMSNEIGENRVLFFVFGGRERWDYRVPFGMCCLSVWIWNWETITRVKTKWGLGSWTTKPLNLNLFFFNQESLESVCEFWIFIFFYTMNFLLFILVLAASVPVCVIDILFFFFSCDRHSLLCKYK